VLELCDLVGVANRRAGSLGLLHRKRLEVARALATDPVVLLLDESAGGLTDEEAGQLVQTIKEVQALGLAIVWIEHVVHVLIQVVGRLICLHGGAVIADGCPEEVMRDQAVIDAYLGSGLV
jgi:branched-chain amino acid transport system ATP-binding protein